MSRPWCPTRRAMQRAGVLLLITLLSVGAGQAVRPTTRSSADLPGAARPRFNRILYGAAYYSEYMPTDRVDQDVAMMQAAGLNVVRMSESTWSLWEPEDGRFEYAWMDRVVEKMNKAGIKVILGTPTYAIPLWMAKAHPEILARPLGGAPQFYGMRQNIDFDNPFFRSAAQRLIEHLVDHYRDNPDVIGWQIDNETHSAGASNPDVFAGFVRHLKQKYGTTDALNQAWFLNYWGQDITRWEDVPPRDSTISTGYKLEWSRWEQMRVTAYLAWQAELVRSHRRPDQFVTQDFAGQFQRDANQSQVSRSLDIVAINPYHGTQDAMDGREQSAIDDFARSLRQDNFLVTETNAQTIGWSSAYQAPPYDGQLRLDVYAHLSTGANMVEYWHWASTYAGQEIYWKGILSQDLEPNRAYAEVSRTAHELQRIGSRLVDFKPHADVAILYSVDSANALDFMPFTPAPSQEASPSVNYTTLLRQMHQSLFDQSVEADFLFPETAAQHLAKYKLVVVPALYVAADQLLQALADYVHGGGHVLMTFKSGFTNENSSIRSVRAPGPLRKAAGFSYQEFSNLGVPLALRGDPFHVGADNQVKYWAEFLQLEGAEVLASYDHPFFGHWPAITRNRFGNGSLIYEGTYLSDTLQRAVTRRALDDAHVAVPADSLPASVRERDGRTGLGKTLHYYLNYSDKDQKVSYRHPAANELLGGSLLVEGQSILLNPWDVAIAEEK